ncbi:hypothetical protein XYCOK13_11760 [Xylanibacillus composti]|uniref:Uncharacterized protein n=1 Tax=Xylanibacillus composti TaxID=1572762 RepID=A0A8J4H2Q4_9BACL|nr:hypothetical protein [Xylanibacillus composti]GIQ68352.1 hypothetical protein XYCOK13_11760 [Xylanibacillus composti]
MQILIDKLEDLVPALKDRDIHLDYDQEFIHDYDGNPEALEVAEER